MDANAQLAALKSFSGVVPHATHYGPLLATVEKGRIVKIEAQASDKALAVQHGAAKPVRVCVVNYVACSDPQSI